jgi:hypothetical protein
VSIVPSSQLFASGPTSVADLLHGDSRPAVVLGVYPTAMYLRLAGGEVIALLTRDAVLLPLGLRLPIHSADHPLDRWNGPVLVGSSQVRIGDRSVRLTRVVCVRAPAGLVPNPHAIASASRGLGHLDHVEPTPGLLEAVMNDERVLSPTDAVGRLLGLGPGLTPAGDDILAGLLVGAWSFGLAADQLRAAVFDAAPARTTALSAALLRCASRGESIPQVSAFVLALSGHATSRGRWDDALGELEQVGHTSGAALAAGVVAAARAAMESSGDAATSASAAPDGHSPRDGSTR